MRSRDEESLAVEIVKAEAARYRAALEDIERGVRTFCDAQGQPTCEPVDYEALVLAYHRTLGHCRDIVDRALHPEEEA